MSRTDSTRKQNKVGIIIIASHKCLSINFSLEKYYDKKNEYWECVHSTSQRFVCLLSKLFI